MLAITMTEKGDYISKAKPEDLDKSNVILLSAEHKSLILQTYDIDDILLLLFNFSSSC